jgi:hypothetical protein
VALQFVGNLFEFFLQRRNAGVRGLHSLPYLHMHQDDSATLLAGSMLAALSLRAVTLCVQASKPHKLTVLGATSGDTGSAAIFGLRNKANVEVYILHPKGRVAPIQEAQVGNGC